jgi:predicted flap endonuclease-1-like 5' DNA nuclease
MSESIGKIKGIEASVQEKLEGAGIRNTDQLLEHSRTPQQRAELARSVGTTPTALKELANRADLMRLKGVGADFSNLLEEAGVNSCKELQHRSAENLYKALVDLHTTKHIAHHAPTQAQVTEWVTEAKTLAHSSAE